MTQPAESFDYHQPQATTVKPRSLGPNLRSQQRVPLELTAELVTENGEHFESRALNVSRSGLMIECPMECLSRLMPVRSSAVHSDSVSIDLEFSLPLFGSREVAILAQAEIIHVRRVARDRFRVGLKFVRVAGNGCLYIEQYVTSRLGSD